MYSRDMETKTTTVLDPGNNETVSRGITPETDSTYTAVTFSASRNFKTLGGAQRWLARRLER